jgi:hypothetical protein
MHCDNALISFCFQVRQLYELLRVDIDSDTVQQEQQHASNNGGSISCQDNTPVVAVAGMSSIAGLPFQKNGDTDGIPDEVNVAGKGTCLASCFHLHDDATKLCENIMRLDLL